MMGKRKKDQPEITENQVSDNISGEENVNPATDSVPEKSGEQEALADQFAVLNDKYLRLYSDFDNYRKRSLKERIEITRNASEELIIKLLPILDDFERAIKAFDVSTDAGVAMKEGTVIIFNKLFSILNQQGLEQMQTIGLDFNTDFHEAITNIPAVTPEMKGKIVDEVERGYTLNSKVIRYAKVVVGS